jgi:hypothetical protein
MHTTVDKFLALYGEEMTVGDFLRTTFTEQSIMQRMNVVVAENGTFTTASILYDDFEHQSVKKSVASDRRPKKYYSVPIDKLEPYL